MNVNLNFKGISQDASISSQKPEILNQGKIRRSLEIELKEIELCIEKTVKFLEDELILSDILLNEYLPAIINESSHQLKLLLNRKDAFDFYFKEISIGNISNFHIETVLYQIKYLKKSYPLVLLMWAVVLFRIGKLLYSNFSNEFIDYVYSSWKEIAFYWLYEDFKIEQICMHQINLTSHLVESAK